MAQFVKTFVAFRNVTETTKIPNGQNEVAFFNVGATAATVNNYPLGPGENLSISGNVGEVFETDFMVAFPGTGAGSVWVIEKRYLL